MMPTVVCIVGPTAVGKTALALQVATRYGTEIISADSRQIYQELNIGTNKPSAVELELVKHHLIDILQPTQTFSAADFEQQALLVLEGLLAQKSVAVIAGGTGFYLQALEHGLDTMPSVPVDVKKAVADVYSAGGLSPLLEELAANDPVSYQAIDRQNPARVKRAIEIIRTTGRPFSSFKKGVARKTERGYRFLKLGLNLPKEALYERIDARVELMLQAGLVEENKGLLEKGYSPDLQSLQTIGYKEVIAYLEGRLTLEDATAQLKQHTRNYAKRQLTWFRRDENTTWFEPGQESAIFDHLDSLLSAK